MAEQIKVRRVLEYVGDPDWIVRTLGRSIGIGRPLRMGNGAIACTQVVSEDARTDDFADGGGNTLPPLVYIAGAFGALSPAGHEENVHRAAAYRMPVAQLGCYPVCPHKNTESLGGPTGFDPDAKQQTAWYEGSIQLLRRCDVLLLIPGWEASAGSKTEKAAAEGWGIPVVYSHAEGDLAQLKAWLFERSVVTP